jgi:hypothetical protein
VPDGADNIAAIFCGDYTQKFAIRKASAKLSDCCLSLIAVQIFIYKLRHPVAYSQILLLCKEARGKSSGIN